jgi:conjugal transfer/entry exclusion protein
MNKLNSIFKKVAELEKNAQEVKLAKHEVNLSIVDEARQSVEKLQKLYEELKKDSIQYQKLKKQQEDYYEILKKKFYEVKAQSKESENIDEKLRTAFRELGLSIKDAWPEWSKFLSIRTEVKSSVNERESSYLWKNK